MHPSPVNNNPHQRQRSSNTQPANYLLPHPPTRYDYVSYRTGLQPQNHTYPNGTANHRNVVGAAPFTMPSVTSVRTLNGERAVAGMSTGHNVHMGQRTPQRPLSLPATHRYDSSVPESSKINRKRVHDDSDELGGKKPCFQEPTESPQTSTNNLSRRVLPLPTPSPAALHLKAFSETPTQHVPDMLSQQILDMYQHCKQQTRLFQQKDVVRESLQCAVRKAYPFCSIYLVGSTVNGFGSSTSDGDLCLVLTEQQQVNQRTEAMCLLQRVLRCTWGLPCMENVQLIRARVPILKFRDKISKVDFDLNVNNIVGIRNTFLLQAYSKVDPRVKPLVLVVKQWATCRSINDASHGTLSSYSLVLMVLHFLQTLPEPVVPCLQKEYPGLFNSSLQICQIPRSANSVPEFLSQNKLSLGELLIGFFKYYAITFDWADTVISLREGNAFKKPLDNSWNKFICIEEPFDQSNTARAVYERFRFEKIKEEFRKAWLLLGGSKNIDKIMLAS